MNLQIEQRKYSAFRYIPVALSIVFIFLIFPPFRQTWVAGIVFVPLLWLMEKGFSIRRAFLTGLLVGTVAYAYVLYWVAYYNVWTYFAVVLCHLPFFALFLGFTSLMFRRYPNNIFIDFLVPPTVWVALSFIYEQTPVGAAGTQVFFYQPTSWMQICRLVGMHGLVFLFLMFNSSIAVALRFPKGLMRFLPLTVSVVLFFATFILGKKALSEDFQPNQPVSLVQHNLPANRDWWIRNHLTIKNQYHSMALEAAKEKPKLIIFPSYSLPFDSYRDPEFFNSLARETNSHLLVATYIPKFPNRRIADVGQYEIAVLYSPVGEVVGIDYSVKGPPFRNIQQSFSEKSEVLRSPIGNLGILLCFEDVLPSLAKTEVKKGADVIIALSNPRIFNRTFLPEYHLYQDQLRAIETGRWVIRVSANGYSAIIDPRGRIIKRTQLGTQEILHGQVGRIQKQ